jgi:serine/threonine protein kinase
VSALFEREFYTLAQLSHPSVIEVYDFGVDDAGPFYTMELLEGGDLSTRAPLAFGAACALMMQVCSSLALLHSRRLVHRDISPRNVRCTRDGAAKLIDFGAMVPLGPCERSVGTPAFKPNSAAFGNGCGARCMVKGQPCASKRPEVWTLAPARCIGARSQDPRRDGSARRGRGCDDPSLFGGAQAQRAALGSAARAR